MKKVVILILFFMIFLITGCGSATTITRSATEEPPSASLTTKTTTTMTTIKPTETTKIKREGKAIAVGIWHRPNVLGNETTLEGIINTLDIFKRCGINIVYLETVYHGMAIYKSKFLPYYTGFEFFDYGEYKDYLSAFTSEAEKRGIEVHAWVEDFYIGIEKGDLFKNHPDWILLDAKGSKEQKEGSGYYFLDPANPEVTNFLINVYYELLSKYPKVKGLNLDYIRYPVSSRSEDTGFTEYAMEDFLNSIHYDLNSELSLLDNFKKAISNNYSLWTAYRADKVTQFVKDVKNMTLGFENIILSTAIFPNMSESYETKKQDFTLWMKNNYIDVVTPMAYYDNTSTLVSHLKSMVNEAGDVYCYTGVSCIYHNLSNSLVNEQINKCLELTDGFVIFGSQRLLNNENYISLLESIFKDKQYYLPHLG